MRLKEISNTVFDIDGQLYYSFGRELIETEEPVDHDVLLLLDPLFLTLLKKNMMKIIEKGYNKVTICLVPFENMELRIVENYFTQLEELLPVIAQAGIEIEFITPLVAEFFYSDGTYFKLENPVFVKIINQFEDQIKELLKRNR